MAAVGDNAHGEASAQEAESSTGSSVPQRMIAPDPKRRRVLITGATGLLGRPAMRFFNERGWQTLGLGHSRAAKAGVACINLFSGEELPNMLDSFRPHVALHFVAERRPDRLEGDFEAAMLINSELPRRIAALCRERSIYLIHLSTNYVFDGRDAPYTELAATNPLNMYGRSKLAGEEKVLEAHPEAAVVRVPLLFGNVEFLGESSVTALFGEIAKPAPKFDNWQERFPTSSEDVALMLEAMATAYLDRGRSDSSVFSGIFHWQSNEVHTKYTMACAIAKLASVDIQKFVRVDDPPAPGAAPRPQFERMLCERLERLLRIEDTPSKFRTSFEDALEMSLRPFLEGDQPQS